MLKNQQYTTIKEIKMFEYNFIEALNSDTPILDVVFLPFLLVFLGYCLRLLIATGFEKVFRITIFFKGIPILGPIACFLFPTDLGLLANLGFYAIDFVATIQLIIKSVKPKKENKNATTNKIDGRPSNP